MRIATIDIEALGPLTTNVGVGRFDEAVNSAEQLSVVRVAMDLRAEEWIARRKALAENGLEAERADQVFNLDVEIVDAEGEPRNPPRLD